MADADFTPSKACTGCKESKPLAQFNVNRAKRDGLDQKCKTCAAERLRAWREKNPAQAKAHAKKYYAAHSEEITRRVRDARKQKPEVFRERERARWAKDRQARSAAHKAWYLANRERADAKIAEWRAANPAAKQRWQRDAHYRGMQDPAFRLRKRVSAALRRSLGGKGGKGSSQLLGFTSEQLRAHIERQFTKGMTWDNMGEWHIDHIIPLSSFKITGPDDPEFRRAWALANLRPLWAAENISKSAKVLTLL